MPDTYLRYRSFLANHLRILVVSLVITSVLGAGLIATAQLSPETTTVEQPTKDWQTTSEITHEATVTEPNPIYDTGTTLSNRSIYFTELTPQLDGAYVGTYTARESGDLSGTVTVSAIHRAVTGDQQDKTVMWETEQELNSTTLSNVDPGDSIRVPFTADVAAIQNQSEETRETINTTQGQTEIEIVATTTYTGTVNGQSVDHQEQHSLPIELNDNLYHVHHPGTQTEEFTSTERVAVASSSSPLHRIGGPALFLGSISGLLALGYAHRRDCFTITAEEREQIAYQDDRNDYDEWVTTMTLPDDALECAQGNADSLGSLVDFAIDTGNAVIEDPERDLFVVLHEGNCYVYDPPTRLHSDDESPPSLLHEEEFVEDSTEPQPPRT